VWYKHQRMSLLLEAVVDNPLGVVMREKGLSDRRAAALAGVSPMSINNWRSGRVKPKQDALKRLADALGDRRVLDVEVYEPPVEYPVPLPLDPENPRNAVAVALNRRGMSIGEAARRIGVHPTTIRNWVECSHRPDKANLVRLATELDAPEILEVEAYDPSRRWVVARCPDCDKEREYRLSDLEGYLKKDLGTSLTIDYSTGEAIYRCGACAQRKNIKDWERSLSRRPGGKTEYWKEMGRRLGRVQLTMFTPEERVHRGAVARAARPPNGQKQRLSHGRASLKFQPKFGPLRVCRCCGYLVQGLGSRDPEETHWGCLQKYRTQRREKGSGKAYPPTRRYRTSTPEELAISREITLRVLRDRQPIKSLIKELQNRGEKVPTSIQGIYQRINRFLALFPPDDRGSKKLNRLRDLLWGLAKERGFVI